MSRNEKLYNRIKGSIIGVAYGDAMGMPTEMLSRKRIKNDYPDGITSFLPSNPEHPFARPMKAGEITDDTINTMMIIDMLKETKGVITAEKYVKHLKNWIENSDKSAYVSGPSTLAAIDKLESGVSIEKSGINGTTNGAQMKITPVGVISTKNNISELVQNVSEICMPTHNTSIAIQGASAVAVAINYSIHGNNDYRYLWNVTDDAIEYSKKYGFDHPSPSLQYRMKQAHQIVNEHENYADTLDRLYYEVGTSLDTIQTVPAVFAIVHIAKGDPILAASLSAMVGYDTDTIGAIATSICGAMNPNFPEEDILFLEAVNDIDFDDLTQVLYDIVK